MGAFADFVFRTRPIAWFRLGEALGNANVDQMGTYSSSPSGTLLGGEAGLLTGDTQKSTKWLGAYNNIGTQILTDLTDDPQFSVTIIIKVTQHLTQGDTDRQFLVSLGGDAGPQIYRWNSRLAFGVWNYNTQTDTNGSWTRVPTASLVLNASNIATFTFGTPDSYTGLRQLISYINGEFADTTLMNNFKNMKYDHWSKDEASFCGNPWGNNTFSGGWAQEVIIHDRMLSFDDTMILHSLVNTSGIKSMTGDINESLPVTQWNIRANLLSTGECTAAASVTGTTYDLEIPEKFEDEPQSVTCVPEQGTPWVAATAYVVDDLVYSTDPVSDPHFYKCTTAGTSHATTEPTWPTSGTVSDNTVVWTYVSPLVQPKTHSPMFAS